MIDPGTLVAIASILTLFHRPAIMMLETMVAVMILPFRLLRNRLDYHVWDIRPGHQVARDILAGVEEDS